MKVDKKLLPYFKDFYNIQPKKGETVVIIENGNVCLFKVNRHFKGFWEVEVTHNL